MTFKMKIKTGDTVKVLSGKDKGKTGKVLRVLPGMGKIVVENVNIHTKFQRSKRAGQPGTKVSLASPFHVGKVMLIDAAGNPTRVGYTFLENGTKQRISRSSGKAT